ncbi:hypothetical protein BJX96DRAFT_30893 [Aspergillus floccosus]
MMSPPKLKKAYRGQWDRTLQEQIRKRRHNLFKRLKEFNDRYGIEIWMTMRMPSGRIYTFATDPSQTMPSEEEIRALNVPVVHKSPADYIKDGPTSRLPDPPSLPFLDLVLHKSPDISPRKHKLDDHLMRDYRQDCGADPSSRSSTQAP